jgi:hypothetical protein
MYGTGFVNTKSATKQHIFRQRVETIKQRELV